MPNKKRKKIGKKKIMSCKITDRVLYIEDRTPFYIKNGRRKYVYSTRSSHADYEE